MRLYLAFVAIRVDLPFITILWVSASVLLILSLPITIAGIGLRETGFAWFLALYGIEPEKGVILGGILSLQLFMNRGLGALMDILETKSSYKV